MTRYLISFDAHAMDHIPDQDMPAVAKSSHAVVQEAVNAGVWVFGGGLCARHSADAGAGRAVGLRERPDAEHPVRRGASQPYGRPGCRADRRECARHVVTLRSWCPAPAVVVVDRFVDRASCASGAISVIGGTTPWYPCR